MKWNNKLHEFDQLAINLLENFKNKKFYIFGAGILGKELLPVLKYFDCFSAFIDNDQNKQKQDCCSERVLSLDEYVKNNNDGIIVIAVAEKNISSISSQLEDYGLQRNLDFFEYYEFVDRILPIFVNYYYKKTFIHIAQITVTERCSLKCKKCAHACYMVKPSAKDMSIEEVHRSADSFFSKVDYIKELVLIGGEPLLYKELDKAILYIGEKYRDRMSVLCITTNGTIIPSDDILSACRKYDVLFRISNYSQQIPRLSKVHKRLTEKLEEWNISYILGSSDTEWYDYGFEYVNHGNNTEELIQTFDKCKTRCREIRGNRFYYCVMARSVSENLNFNIGEDDYYDLDKMDDESSGRELLEYNLGFSEKGYLDMCQHCHGAEAPFYTVPVAEQIN